MVDVPTKRMGELELPTVDLKQCLPSRGTAHHWQLEEQGQSKGEFSLARCKFCKKVKSQRNWLEAQHNTKWGSK